MAERPEWIVDGQVSPFKCWMCKGPTKIHITAAAVDVYSICEKCNPTHEFEWYTDGCEIICQVCFKETFHAPEAGSACFSCGRFICENCEGDCDMDEELPDGGLKMACSEKCKNKT